MGHAPGSSLLRRRRLRVRIKRALLVVAAGPAPPTIERVPNLAVRDPTFVGTLEAHLGAPVVGGNRVDLLLNGDDIFPALLSAIRGARTSIDYAQYFWADGVVAR